MYPDTPSRLRAAQVALITSPVLAAVSIVFQPNLDGPPREQLAALGASPLAAVSAVAFLVSQLPLLIAVLAIGRLLLPRAPRLSAWGTALGVLGCFGHIVFGGTSMVMVMMARDQANRGVYADLLTQLQSSPVMLFSLAGLGGTVLGLMLLGIGVFRTRTGLVWVGPAIWAFLLVEFIGSALSAYASYVSVLLLGAAFFALVGQLAPGKASDEAATSEGATPFAAV
ncbi:hypothetical protein GCM10027596_40570 [Nocardioides korecus]